MDKANFNKAERLLPLRKQIDQIARTLYEADNNHHGSACQPSFDSGYLANAHEYLRRALGSIDDELKKL